MKNIKEMLNIYYASPITRESRRTFIKSMATLMVGLLFPENILYGFYSKTSCSKIRLILIAPRWRSVSLINKIQSLNSGESKKSIKTIRVDQLTPIHDLQKFLSKGSSTSPLCLIGVVGGLAELEAIRRLTSATGRTSHIIGIVSYPFSFEGTHSPVRGNHSCKLLIDICKRVHILKNEDFIHQFPSRTPIAKVFNHSDSRLVELLNQVITNAEKTNAVINRTKNWRNEE